jgi:hypothetical protein
MQCFAVSKREMVERKQWQSERKDAAAQAAPIRMLLLLLLL